MFVNTMLKRIEAEYILGDQKQLDSQSTRYDL